MTDLKTATSAQPGLQIAATQLTTSEATLFTCPAGVTFLGDVWLTTVSGTPTASLSLVKSGGTASASNRIFSRAFTTGESVKLSGIKLAPGDFISGIASAGTAVSVVVDGTAFSSTTVGVAAGIHLDSVSDHTGRGDSGVSPANPQDVAIAVGSGPNRYLKAAVAVGHNGTVNTATGTFGYDTLTCTCADGAMTLLTSARYGAAGSATATVHLFGRANPTPGARTVTATAVKAALTINTLQVFAEAWTGVASVSGATAFNNTSAATPNASLVSATGKRAVWALTSNGAVSDLDRQLRYMNGPAVDRFGDADWLAVCDAAGAATIALTGSNSINHAAVGVNLDPA